MSFIESHKSDPSSKFPFKSYFSCTYKCLEIMHRLSTSGAEVDDIIVVSGIIHGHWGRSLNIFRRTAVCHIFVIPSTCIMS